MESHTQQKDPRLRKILLSQLQPSTTWSYTQCPTIQVREDTPWPNTIPASTSLFEARAGWPVPPTLAPSMKVENREVLSKIATILCAMVLPKKLEKMYMGTALPHLHKRRGRRHRGLEWQQAERLTKKSLSTKCSASPLLWCPWQVLRADQIKKRMGWKDGMPEWKYDLDYYSSSESNSAFKPEHKYETLIWTLYSFYQTSWNQF